jgi:hypothetical protein
MVFHTGVVVEALSRTQESFESSVREVVGSLQVESDSFLDLHKLCRYASPDLADWSSMYGKEFWSFGTPRLSRRCRV